MFLTKWSFWGNDWFYCCWNLDCAPAEDLHINEKELLTVMLAAARWCHEWQNQRIYVFSDNMVTVYQFTKFIIRILVCSFRYVIYIINSFFLKIIVTCRTYWYDNNVVSFDLQPLALGGNRRLLAYLVPVLFVRSVIQVVIGRARDLSAFYITFY